MSRVTGHFPSRVKTSRHSATSPMSFDYIADVSVEPAQPTAEAQARRDAEWDRFVMWAQGLADTPSRTSRFRQESPCA